LRRFLCPVSPGRTGSGGLVSERRRLGRVEAALEAHLLERSDIRRSERSALRAQAHAVDLAEASGDPDLVTRANDGYLRLRAAAGLTSGGAKPVDAFDDLMVRLARPAAGAGDIPNR
jgi:hypothetical protein